MCGVFGIVDARPVNQTIYDALLLLQHRGQDAAGIATMEGTRFSQHRARGSVVDVFRTRNMRDLLGNAGIGHVRYPTAGTPESLEEAQPFYSNAPFGVMLVHNGNLTNAKAILHAPERRALGHINTNSDSEVLLGVLVHELGRASQGEALTPAMIGQAVQRLHDRVLGSYAFLALIAGVGLLAVRDPIGIRPLCLGERRDRGASLASSWAFASESVALEGQGFHLVRDVAPGEALLVDEQRQLHVCLTSRGEVVHLSDDSASAALTARSAKPCAFEFVYFARPDSYIDGVSVYAARVRMGRLLAERIASQMDPKQIDVVMPVPESSRPQALQLALTLERPYREGLIKNRYVGRTFIMPGQEVRKRSIRQKLHCITEEFRGKNVLLVDDSIVRGNTSSEIVLMARQAGARQVFLASAAPPVRYPNVYGIDMPTRTELLAHGRSEDECRTIIGCDRLFYQSIEAMREAILGLNPRLEDLETSCFDGRYTTGDVDDAYLDQLERDTERLRQLPLPV